MKDKYYCAKTEKTVDPDKCKKMMELKDVDLYEHSFDSVIEDLILFFESPDTNRLQYTSFLDLWKDFVEYQYGED